MGQNEMAVAKQGREQVKVMCKHRHPMVTLEGRMIIIRCPRWWCRQTIRVDLLQLLIRQVTDGHILGDEVVAAMESLRETGLIDLRGLEERQKQQKVAEEAKRLQEAKTAEAKRMQARLAAEESVLLEAVRVEIEGETNAFLKGLGRSASVPKIPFCFEQVEHYRRYAKEVLGYDGQVLWWIPNGVRFEDFLDKHPALEGLDDTLWQQSSFDDRDVPGSWVLWAPRLLPNSKKGVSLKAEALERLDADIATYAGAHVEVLSDVETVYLALVAKMRGHAFPDESEWILAINRFDDEEDLLDEDNWGVDLVCTAFRFNDKGMGRKLEMKVVGVKLKDNLGIAPAIGYRGEADDEEG